MLHELYCKSDKTFCLFKFVLTAIRNWITFLIFRKENRRKKQRIGAALRGADPKLRTDSDSSSVEDGDSGTRSSFEEDGRDCEENASIEDNQDSAVTENVVVVFNIPDSVKQLLEEDAIKVKCRKRVRNSCTHYL